MDNYDTGVRDHCIDFLTCDRTSNYEEIESVLLEETVALAVKMYFSANAYRGLLMDDVIEALDDLKCDREWMEAFDREEGTDSDF